MAPLTEFWARDELNAGLDPIIAILVGVGWFIVKALMNRREDADSWGDMERPAPPRPQAPPPRTPQAGSPTSPPPIRPAAVVLTPQKRSAPPRTPTLQPPPIVRTTAPHRPPIVISEREGPTAIELPKLKESRESYSRAASLQRTVAQRLTAIDQQTATHKPAAPKPRMRTISSAHILRTMRNPVTVRQAFLASFVLNPPKALE
jgi:hypothetical protein